MRVACLALILLFTVSVAHAADVKITRVAADVTDCTTLGTVKSVPPYWTRSFALTQLKDQAMALGADTVLITGGGKLTALTGVAYRCAR